MSPQVIVPGGAVEVANTYIGDAATTFVKGDLVRITTSGQIQNAAADTDTSAGSMSRYDFGNLGYCSHNESVCQDSEVCRRYRPESTGL